MMNRSIFELMDKIEDALGVQIHPSQAFRLYGVLELFEENIAEDAWEAGHARGLEAVEFPSILGAVLDVREDAIGTTVFDRRTWAENLAHVMSTGKRGSLRPSAWLERMAAS